MSSNTINTNAYRELADNYIDCKLRVAGLVAENNYLTKQIEILQRKLATMRKYRR